MFEAITDKEERGQVGIGTLIVFIAMVLVAAIAAGVLINTAGFLQTQAEATGEESTSQVSDRVQVDSVVSEVEGGSGSEEIRAVAIDVSLAAGSDPIDLTDATIEWIGEEDTGTFDIGSEDPATVDGDEGPFADEENFETELTDESDSARIYILTGEDNPEALDLNVDTGDEFTELGDDLPLQEGDEADVRITTASGGQAHATVRVPDVLEDGEGVRL